MSLSSSLFVDNHLILSASRPRVPPVATAHDIDPTGRRFRVCVCVCVCVCVGDGGEFPRNVHDNQPLFRVVEASEPVHLHLPYDSEGRRDHVVSRISQRV